jgi:glycerophosphoryl diester phosphodiesterase
VHAAGLAAVAWTVNDAEQARSLARAGVDVLITDEPLLLAAPPPRTALPR